jgi:hypothetical protein
MLRDIDDLVINGINVVPYLTNLKVEYNKIWGQDTGRNSLSGKYTGTLVGIFPKFICSFRKLTKAEMELLIPVLDSATQNVTYYDPNKKMKITIATYTGDYGIEQKRLLDSAVKKGEPFSISFIARNKR